MTYKGESFSAFSSIVKGTRFSKGIEGICVLILNKVKLLRTKVLIERKI